MTVVAQLLVRFQAMIWIRSAHCYKKTSHLLTSWTAMTQLKAAYVYGEAPEGSWVTYQLREEPSRADISPKKRSRQTPRIAKGGDCSILHYSPDYITSIAPPCIIFTPLLHLPYIILTSISSSSPLFHHPLLSQYKFATFPTL